MIHTELALSAIEIWKDEPHFCMVPYKNRRHWNVHAGIVKVFSRREASNEDILAALNNFKIAAHKNAWFTKCFFRLDRLIESPFLDEFYPGVFRPETFMDEETKLERAWKEFFSKAN